MPDPDTPETAALMLIRSLVGFADAAAGEGIALPGEDDPGDALSTFMAVAKVEDDDPEGRFPRDGIIAAMVRALAPLWQPDGSVLVSRDGAMVRCVPDAVTHDLPGTAEAPDLAPLLDRYEALSDRYSAVVDRFCELSEKLIEARNDLAAMRARAEAAEAAVARLQAERSDWQGRWQEQAALTGRMREERDAARVADAAGLREATDLATAIWRRHYFDVPQWKPLDYTAGVISQIDNMVAGLNERLLVAEQAALASPPNPAAQPVEPETGEWRRGRVAALVRRLASADDVDPSHLLAGEWTSTYDAEADVLYVTASDNSPALVTETTPSVLWRFAVDDLRLVGLTLVDASRFPAAPDEVKIYPAEDGWLVADDTGIRARGFATHTEAINAWLSPPNPAADGKVGLAGTTAAPDATGPLAGEYGASADGAPDEMVGG